MFSLTDYLESISEEFQELTGGYTSVDRENPTGNERSVRLKVELDDEIFYLTASGPHGNASVSPAAIARELTLLFDRRERTHATAFHFLPDLALEVLIERARRRRA